MDKIKDLVDKQLDSDISNLAVMEPGSPEKAAEVENITKMIKARSEANTQKWDMVYKIAGVGTTLLTLAVGVYIKISGMNKTFKFEETGTISSQQGRENLRFDPFKWLR